MKETKVYHVETQEDYDELMIELEEKCCKWESGDNPTAFDSWYNYKEKTYVKEENKELTYGNVKIGYVNLYSEYPLIKYKAKGENMTQEEMKQKLQKNAFDISVAIGTFARGTLTAESDLQEAKTSAKKLIEKIDDYLETLKPEFKVGDYVTVYVSGRKITAKIDELTENKTVAHGLWYDRTNVNVEKDFWFLTKGSKFRHATPEEITEYEVALNFHKHGREPFEVKEGDIILDDKGKILKDDEVSFLSALPKNTKKEHLIKGRYAKKHYTFLKTVEEYNEWLENK